MFRYQVSFESPWYLLLLVLVPVIWWFSFRSLALSFFAKVSWLVQAAREKGLEVTLALLRMRPFQNSCPVNIGSAKSSFSHLAGGI